MATIKTRSERDSMGNAQRLYDDTTQESVARYQAVVFDEDFIGGAHAASGGIPATLTVGYPWIKKLVGTTSCGAVALVSNASGGVVSLAVGGTSEKEEATLYWGDVLNIDATKNAVFEARVNLAVLPVSALDEIAFGLCSAWADGPDNISYYMQFHTVGGGTGAINYRTKDGVNTVSTASGVSVAAGDWHNYRIDCTDPTHVTFAIDGVKTEGFAFAATGANAILQPYFSVYKTGGTELAAMQIDMVQTGMNRAA